MTAVASVNKSAATSKGIERRRQCCLYDQNDGAVLSTRFWKKKYAIDEDVRKGLLEGDVRRRRSKFENLG